MSLHDRGDGTLEFTDGKDSERALLVCETYSSNEDWNGDCDYCVVPISAEKLTIMKRQMKHLEYMRENDPEFNGLLSLEFFDYSPSWVSYSDEIDDFLGADSERSYFTLIMGNKVEEFEKLIEGKEQRIDCAVLMVGSGWVGYECTVKHTGVRISSATLYDTYLNLALETLEIKDKVDPNILTVLQGG
jgi:hypothetical protein